MKFIKWASLLALAVCVVGSAGALLLMNNPFGKSAWPDVEILKKQFPLVEYQGPKIKPVIHWTRARPSQWVSLPEIAPFMVGAVIVSEDWGFYAHAGFDWDEIKKAAEEDWEAKSFVRGASTLTQQLAKNLFLTQEKSLWRKLKEFYLAKELEEKLGKQKILTAYMNIVEWGPGVFGIRPASQYYFQKDPALLSPREAAFLAMLLPSPIRYGESFRKKNLTSFARRSVDRVLFKLEKAHYLTPEEYESAKNSQLPFELDAPPPIESD